MVEIKANKIDSPESNPGRKNKNFKQQNLNNSPTRKG